MGAGLLNELREQCNWPNTQTCSLNKPIALQWTKMSLFNRVFTSAVVNETLEEPLKSSVPPQSQHSTELAAQSSKMSGKHFGTNIRKKKSQFGWTDYKEAPVMIPFSIYPSIVQIVEEFIVARRDKVTWWVIVMWQLNLVNCDMFNYCVVITEMCYIQESQSQSEDFRTIKSYFSCTESFPQIFL